MVMLLLNSSNNSAFIVALPDGYSNKETQVESLTYVDILTCHMLCCHQPKSNINETSIRHKPNISRSTSSFEERTKSWISLRNICKSLQNSKYSDLQSHLDPRRTRKNDVYHNTVDKQFCASCLNHHVLKANNLAFYQNSFLRFPKRYSRSSISTSEQKPLLDKTKNMIPTFMLPALYSVPVRAISIHPSNLIPLSSGNITITFSQLTFLKYQFHVVQIKYGVIQINIGNDQSEWKQADSFTGLQVLKQKIRYIGLVAQPESTHTSFTDRIHMTCFRNSETPGVLRLLLPVNFIRIHMTISINRPLLIHLSAISDGINPHLIGVEGRTARLDSRYLEVKVEPREKDSLIWFTLTKIPLHGHLFLVSRNNNDNRQMKTNKESDDKVYLGISSRFTQEDLKAGNLFYTFRRVLDENIERISDINSKSFSLTDEFKYRVHVEGAQPKRIYNFSIIINKLPGTTSTPSVNFSPTIINKGGFVEEGGNLILTPGLFYAQHSQCQNNSIKKLTDGLFQEYDLYFQVLSPPEHGLLFIKSPYNSSVYNVINFVEYSHKLIDYNLLIYHHSGEEEFQDSFQFQFLCRQIPSPLSSDDNGDITSLLTGLTHASLNEQFGQPVTSVFHINIIPVNDNPPNLSLSPLLVEFNKTNHTLEKSIEISDRDKISTNEYLNNINHDKFIQKNGNFWITWEENRHFRRNDLSYPDLGYFMHSFNRIIRHRFKYSEVCNGLISFKHMGFPAGQMNIKVMDGKFTTSKLLPINVTKPVFLVLQPNYITLGLNGMSFIPIEVLTNINLDPSNVHISIVRSGCFGNLMLFGGSKQSPNWTYHDLLQFPLYYEYMKDHDKLANSNIVSSKNATYSLYCKLLRSTNMASDNDDWNPSGLDEIHLFFQTLYAGRSLQQEVKLSVLLNQISQWNKDIDGKKADNFTGSDNFVNPSQILIIVDQIPRYGILYLCTASFKISTIKYFTLADVIGGRIIYEPLKNQLNTIKSHFSQRLLARDCIKFSIIGDQMEYIINDMELSQMKDAVKGRLQQVICISIMQTGLDLKHLNLALEPRDFRSLTDSQLTPVISNENPVRHDEPFRMSELMNLGNENQNTESEMTKLSDSFWKMDLLHVQNKKHKKNIEDDYKIYRIKTAKILYNVRSGPNFGLLISRKLNRTVRLFSDLDLAMNDILYHNHGNESVNEDLVELTALDLTTETMSANPVKIKFTLNEITPRPYLIHCQPMRILSGSSTVITTNYIDAGLSNGFESGQIIYEILHTHQGHIAFLNNLSISQSTFTQMDLQKRRVVFVHSGLQKGKICGFAFVLTYNLHRSEIYQFQIIPGTVQLDIRSNNTLLAFPKGFEIITPDHMNVQIKFIAQIPPNYETSSLILKEDSSVNVSSMKSISNEYGIDSELGLYVVYKILSQPRYGFLIKLSGTKGKFFQNRNERITEFTQEDISTRRIAYVFHPENWLEDKKQHVLLQLNSDIEDEYIISASIVKGNITVDEENYVNHNNNLHSGVKDNNPNRISDIINYHDYAKQLLSQIIFGSVSISYNYILKYNQNRLLKIHPLVAYNGHVAEITSRDINTDQVRGLLESNGSESKSFKIVKTTQHGSLWFGSKLVETGTVIPGIISGVLSEKFIYQHDGSSTKEDSFELLISQLKRPLANYEQPVTFPIHIVPNVNTSLKIIYPTTVISRKNLFSTNKNVIVVKKNDYATITEKDLLIHHAFIQPQFIYISFKVLPRYGKLYYSYNSFRQEHDALIPECETLHKITQDDINMKRLRYYANYVSNKNENSETAVYDSVTFEVYQEEYLGLPVSHLSGTLQFQIIPGDVMFHNSVELSLLQNETKLWFDADMFQVESSKWKTYQINQLVWFRIRRLPNYGRIFLDTIPVISFNYHQLIQKRVFYEKTNFSTANDSFIVEINGNICGANLKSRSIFLSSDTDSSRILNHQSSSLGYSPITLTVYISVKSIVFIETLYITPGKMSRINAANLKITEFENFMRKYYTSNIHSPKNEQKVLSTSIFTFPTGTALKSGRFYTNNRLVISSGYLEDKASSSINISLQDFQTNSVSFEAYEVDEDGAGMYEEIVPYIFTSGPFNFPTNYLASFEPVVSQPGHGSFKILMKNSLSSLRESNSRGSDNENRGVLSPSLALFPESKLNMLNENAKYLGTGKIAFTIAGLALSLAFISVLVICAVGCCIYKRKNKTGKNQINTSESSEKCMSNNFSITASVLTGESLRSPNKCILKANHTHSKVCLGDVAGVDVKLDSLERTNSPIISVKSSKVTFDKKTKIDHIIPAEIPTMSTQDCACSCDFSGAVIYWTGDMQVDNRTPTFDGHTNDTFYSSNDYSANSTFHLISPNSIIAPQPAIISSSVSSSVSPIQQQPSHLTNPFILTHLPTESLKFPSFTLLSRPKTISPVNLGINDIISVQSPYIYEVHSSKHMCNSSSLEDSSKDGITTMHRNPEITDHCNVKNVETPVEFEYISTLSGNSQKKCKIDESFTCVPTNVRENDFNASHI
ncbi:unnamed protein product [Heterobilharzia americana]|nr:unnamed protein product [Heterobilharzia americana]